MALQEEINNKAKEIHTDSYPMSIGEIISLYKDNEIDIHPEFQRFFRWTPLQKTKLIESLLLGLPVPPIFVSQRENGIWDVIDGLQRLSTIFEFVGVLQDGNGGLKPPSELLATKYLPSLKGKYWHKEEDPNNSFDAAQRLIIKRAKLEVQIIKKESDPNAKYELFQRLNTGGTALTDQEIRNCIMIMLNKDFYRWLDKLASYASFQSCLTLTDRAFDEQYDLELALRFFVYKYVTFEEIYTTIDVGEVLTNKTIDFANNKDFDFEKESNSFKKTFNILNQAFGENVFKKYDSTKDSFSGAFSISAFEVIVFGLAKNIDKYDETPNSIEIIKDKIKSLHSNVVFKKNSGSGVKAASRLPNLLPLGEKLFANEN